VESPEIIAAGDRNASSFEGPAGTELELVDMVCERETVSSTEMQQERNNLLLFFLFLSLRPERPKNKRRIILTYKEERGKGFSLLSLSLSLSLSLLLLLL
jgi:hypothetical protein